MANIHRKRLEKLIGKEIVKNKKFCLSKRFIPIKYIGNQPSSNKETQVMAEDLAIRFLKIKISATAGVSRKQIKITKVADTNAVGKGMDLMLQVSRRKPIYLEVKGTIGTSPVKNLIVSSSDCFDRLKEGYPLFRITHIMEKNPQLHILWHREDFELEPEKRWRYKATKKNSK